MATPGFFYLFYLALFSESSNVFVKRTPGKSEKISWKTTAICFEKISGHPVSGSSICKTVTLCLLFVGLFGPPLLLLH